MVLFAQLCYNHMHKWDTLPSTLYTLGDSVAMWIKVPTCNSNAINFANKVNVDL